MNDTNGKGTGRSEPEPNRVDRDERGWLLPGSNLNPEGGRRGYTAQVRKQLQGIMEAEDTDDEDKRERMTVLLLAVYARAIKGDMTAAKLILDRVYPATIHATIDTLAMSAKESIGVLGHIRIGMETKAKPELPEPKSHADASEQE